MTHSREFYLLDDEPSVDDDRPGFAYPAYFPAEDRTGVVFRWWGVYYPSAYDPTPGYHAGDWPNRPLTRLNP